MTRSGSITEGDVTVHGLASTIADGQPVLAENGSNYIYLIDAGGLRVAHFGIIGQEALSEEQLEALGRVDVAITPLSYPFSRMTAENRKAFNLMDQVHPRLVVPTQFEELTARYAVEHWAGAYAPSAELKLTAATLPEHTTVVFIGSQAEPMGKLLDLPVLETLSAP
jgi:L-ascorbate metabolism protein UlaG (beta-lactamase superfamily)